MAETHTPGCAVSLFIDKLSEYLGLQGARQADVSKSIEDAEVDVLRIRAELGRAAVVDFDARQNARAAPGDKNVAKAAAAAFARMNKINSDLTAATQHVESLRALKSALSDRDAQELARLKAAGEAERRAKLRGAFATIEKAHADFDAKVAELIPILETAREAQGVVRNLAGDKANYVFATATWQIIPCIERRLWRFLSNTTRSENPDYKFWATFTPRPDSCGIDLTEKE